MWKGNRKWHLVMLVQLLLFLHGVEMQQQQRPEPKFQQQQRKQIEPERKPQVYWATSMDNNRRFQQANEWDVVTQPDYVYRQWPGPPQAPYPTPAPNSPPASSTTIHPPPAPVYAPPSEPVYVPPPTLPHYQPYMTAPPAYHEPAPPAYHEPAPPAYHEPAPPAYHEPAPPAYHEPAPPAYHEPAPAAYHEPSPAAYHEPVPAAYHEPAPPAYHEPATPPAYDSSAPYYGPPQSPPGQYNYYIPVKESKEKGPSIKDMLEKDKQALVALLPDHNKHLSYEQKIWLSILTPLIVVALVVPLAAVIFSGFTITTNGRKFGELNMTDMKKSILDIAEGYGSVLETDECMQRIICDLGSYAKSIPGKSYILTFLSILVPDTMKNNVATFQRAATYGADKAHCNSFKCLAWKY